MSNSGFNKQAIAQAEAAAGGHRHGAQHHTPSLAAGLLVGGL
jgi:hypothetical protein